MNREIKTKKIGKQKKLTNPCPVIKGETEVMVGSPRCITCQWFERKLRRMEKPMSTAIDYNSLENKVIEDRVREYYPHVKGLIEMVITKRLRYQNIPHGLCADFIEEDKKLWREVIKPWFTPQRFGLTHVYFGYSNHLIEIIKDDTLNINGRLYFRVSMKEINKHPYLLGTAFWFPISREYGPMRIKILECALEDLERIKDAGDIPLPPLTEDKSIMY